MTRARKPLARRFKVATFLRRHTPCWDDDKLADYLDKFEDDTWCALDVLELPDDEVSRPDKWWAAWRMMTHADIEAAHHLHRKRANAHWCLPTAERIATVFPRSTDAAKDVLRRKYRRREAK